MQKTIASNKYKNLIDWLVAARKKQGITIRALARQLEINHSAVQRIESLERRLDVNEYVIYCKALRVNPHEGLDML
ncbi:MAG: helix-turn-helix transcriptional regulator [Cycloclasticus sp.]